MVKRILIAEDDHNILISLTFLMEQCGHQVRSGNNGVDTLAIASEFRPHVLLLDIMLPLKNGFEVCEALRAAPDSGSLKIIMLSAKGRDSEIVKGYEAGADAYVTKPFSTRELTATVQRLLDAR